jgi:hypothetical protein
MKWSALFFAGLFVAASMPALATGPSRAAAQSPRYTGPTRSVQVTAPGELSGQEVNSNYTSGSAAIARSQRETSLTGPRASSSTDLGDQAVPSRSGVPSMAALISSVSGRLACYAGSIFGSSANCSRGR